MKRYIAHLRRELLHKWYVFKACCRLGVPWLGVIHDWTKFLPIEFGPYARHYYTPDGKQLSRGRECVGDYCYALLHHFNCNKHHPEHWVLGNGPLPIPDRHRREMLADWYGYEGTNHKPAAELYLELRNTIVLHPDTRAWVEDQLGVAKETQ